MNYSLRFTRMWDESADCFPDGLQDVDPGEKRSKEKQFEQFRENLKAELDQSPTLTGSQADHRLVHLLSDFFTNTIGYPDDLTRIMFSDGMIDSTYSFIRAARQFDPAISFSDLFQAIRNVWIMNGLQFLLDSRVCLTPSIFAYSLLYPYTDNYLDHPTVSQKEKQEFCVRFGKRLKGENTVIGHEQERKIFRMIDLIEAQWERDRYPKVYDSLLAIHHAQTLSIKLISKLNHVRFDEGFKICIQKGGTSVVADGYLVFGDLTPEQEEFFYYYGAYLQLLDDLQDVGTDLSDSLMTAYAILAGKEKLDKWLNKTYYLGLKILDCAERINSERLPAFKALMKKSTDLFLTAAVLTNRPFFSEGFVRDFEAFSPMSFSFIREKEHTWSPFQNELFEQVLKKTMADGPHLLFFH